MNYSRGGYIPDAEGATPATPGGTKVQPIDVFSKASRGDSKMGLLECTITPDSRLAVSAGAGGDAASATIYGCVRQVTEGAQFHEFAVEDGTSFVTVRRWIGERTIMDPVEIGQWVRVSLSARMGSGGKASYSASRVEPVRDFNDVLLHLLQAIDVHFTGGRRGESSAQPPSKIPNTAGYEEPATHFSGAAGSMTPIQTTVMKVFQENTSDVGAHIQAVCRRLSEKYPEDAVRQTVAFLLDEGYLYQTIEDHAKSVLN